MGGGDGKRRHVIVEEGTVTGMSEPIFYLIINCKSIKTYPGHCVFYNYRWSDGMRCCRGDWPVFYCYQPSCAVSQHAFFFFSHSFSNFTSPFPPRS